MAVPSSSRVSEAETWSDMISVDDTKISDILKSLNLRKTVADTEHWIFSQLLSSYCGPVGCRHCWGARPGRWAHPWGCS